MNHVSRQELSNWLDHELQIYRFKDYAPNGLQLQGKPYINKIVMGVTASKELLEKAAATQADEVIVHHGWFWKNEDVRIIGMKYERIALAIKHQLNVFGYHLPLDAHPQWGNNAQLAKVLGLRPNYIDGTPETTGQDDLVWLGAPPEGVETLAQLTEVIAKRLQREPLFIGNPDTPIQRIAWCTGGAQSYFDAAILAGAQAFITGEASEPVFHMAQESGVAYYAAGHHATERYGVQALGLALQAEFPSIEVEFIDIPNPI